MSRFDLSILGLSLPKTQHVFADDDGSSTGKPGKDWAPQRSYASQQAIQPNDTRTPPSSPPLVHCTPSPGTRIPALTSANKREGLLRVYSYAPSHGEPGTMFNVWVEVPAALLEPEGDNCAAFILFDDTKCSGEVGYVKRGQLAFEIWVEVPDLCRDSGKVALKFQLLKRKGTDKAYKVLECVEFGTFSYVDPDPYIQSSIGNPPILNDNVPRQVSLMRTTQVQSRQNRTGDKVTLHLRRKLSDMTEGWSPAELLEKRRLVQFSRRLDGSVLNVSFKKIIPAEYVQDSILVSCISHSDCIDQDDDTKTKHYITSVDLIQLLESLVACSSAFSFTDEEKQRIRRNIENLGPVTVSKKKQEAFFKLIMDFPAPKPRGQEKDIKVFRWETLERALMKVLEKYSVVGTTDATANLVPFATSSESPTLAEASLFNSSEESLLQVETPLTPRMRPEPIQRSYSNYGPHDGMYAFGKNRVRPTSTILNPFLAGGDLLSGKYDPRGSSGLATPPQSSQNLLASSSYDMSPSKNHMLTSAPPHTLQSLSYDSSSSLTQAENDQGERWANDAATRPVISGGAHKTPSNRQSLHPSTDGKDQTTDLRGVHSQSSPSMSNLQATCSRIHLPSRNDNGRTTSRSPNQSTSLLTPKPMYQTQSRSMPDLGDHGQFGSKS